MNTNHKLLIARINDLFSLCDKHCEMKCSDFLDGGELAVIEDEFQIPYGIIRCFSAVMIMRKERCFEYFPNGRSLRKAKCRFPLYVLMCRSFVN